MRFGFIGAGKVGAAIAVNLIKKGYPVIAVNDVMLESAKRFADRISSCQILNNPQNVADAADFVFITTPDSYIKSVADAVKWRPGQIVVHCSGGNTISLIRKAQEDGASVGVFHPGQIFFNTEQDFENIAGSTFDIETEEPLLSTLGGLATALDSHWLRVKAEEKAAYHVAIEFTNLYVMLMARLSSRIMNAMGITTEQAVGYCR